MYINIILATGGGKILKQFWSNVLKIATITFSHKNVRYTVKKILDFDFDYI